MLKRLFLYASVFLLLISTLSFSYYPTGVFAEDDISEDIEDIEDEIKELEKKIANLQSEQKTLQNEIAYFDGQINLTQLRIQNAIAEIDKRTKLLEELVADIGDLEVRIEKLEASIDYQTNVLRERMRARYKVGETTPMMVLFGSTTFNTLIKKTEYLKVMQMQDQKLLDEMESTKEAFTIQKNLFEEKKAQTEQLKAEVEAERANLEVYKADLDQKRASKQALLEQTQNDEFKYQEALRKARAQLEAIQSIVAAIDFKDGVEVDKGDVIAVMGNSGYPGCSTGEHLHFEVRKDGDVRNPEKYLKPKSVPTYDFGAVSSPTTKDIGSGDWDWPMEGRIVTQRFGETPWSWRYPSGRHDGLDMVSNDAFIYAPQDGKLVKGSTGCYGSTLNYAAIDHGDDVATYYLHIR